MKNPLYLNGPCTRTSKEKQKSVLRKNTEELAYELSQLEIKQSIIHSFKEMNKTKLMEKKPFKSIKQIGLINKWTDLEDDENIIKHSDKMNEEIFHFLIETNINEFSVFFSYDGKDEVSGKCVYHLHTPVLKEREILLVKEEVRNQFQVQEDILVTHDYTSLKKERASLFKAHTCHASYDKVELVNDENRGIHHRLTHTFMKGEDYALFVEENGAMVQFSKNKFIYLSKWETAYVFGIGFDGLDIEPSISLKELDDLFDGVNGILK